MSEKTQSFETLTLHAGQTPDPTTLSRAVPLYQTTSYVFKSSEHAANLFGLKEFGNIYTRLMNPTTDVLEQRLAALDGGVAALAVASGQAAITYAILNIAKVGDNIVSTNYLYGGTYNLFHYTLPKLGITVKFVDTSDVENIRKAIDGNTRLIYSESVGNPKNNVDDFEAIAAVAHEAGLPFVVDNTVTTPFLFKPLQHRRILFLLCWVEHGLVYLNGWETQSVIFFIKNVHNFLNAFYRTERVIRSNPGC